MTDSVKIRYAETYHFWSMLLKEFHTYQTYNDAVNVKRPKGVSISHREKPLLLLNFVTSLDGLCIGYYRKIFVPGKNLLVEAVKGID